jgi:hypothetical protein
MDLKVNVLGNNSVGPLKILSNIAAICFHNLFD